MPKTPSKIMESGILYMERLPFQFEFVRSIVQLSVKVFQVEILDRECGNYFTESRFPSNVPDHQQKGKAVDDFSREKIKEIKR